MYWLKVFLKFSFAILVLGECGVFEILSGPIVVPINKFVNWGFRKLQRKKKNWGYSIKKDFGVDSGVDETVKDKELIDFEDIQD